MTPMQLSVALSRSAPKGHKTGTPILSLQPSDLGDFIALEGARVVIDGARYRTCDHCGKGFLTGHGTGRRSTARSQRSVPTTIAPIKAQGSTTSLGKCLSRRAAASRLPSRAPANSSSASLLSQTCDRRAPVALDHLLELILRDVGNTDSSDLLTLRHASLASGLALRRSRGAPTSCKSVAAVTFVPIPSPTIKLFEKLATSTNRSGLNLDCMFVEIVVPSKVCSPANGLQRRGPPRGRPLSKGTPPLSR